MEAYSMMSVLDRAAAGSNKEEPLGVIKRRIMNAFIANHVDVLDSRKVKVYREKGTVVIDANYEKRIPLFKGVDAIFMFTDHVIVIE
jgi:hypothetical protein